MWNTCIIIHSQLSINKKPSFHANKRRAAGVQDCLTASGRQGEYGVAFATRPQSFIRIARVAPKGLTDRRDRRGVYVITNFSWVQEQKP